MPQTLRRPRATVISLGAIAAVFATTALGAAGCSGIGGGTVDTVGEVSFSNPLVIPPLAPSTIDGDGRRVFELTAQNGTTRFLPGKATRTRGFDGSFLGPTIVADSGENVVVNLRNDLDESTTVHWHGMHLPPDMDGGPHQMIEPGATWSPHWTVRQRAATLWYHPHPHGETERQVGEGLAGMFIVDDAEERVLPLPRTYGVDDIPLIVQDKRFDRHGGFDTGTHGFIGTLGDQVLVNGTLGPFLDVTTSLVRLRILNASTARVYDFGFDDDREFRMIASDGGLLTAPVALSRIRLSPGERAEVVVSMTPGETTILRSTPPDLGLDAIAGSMNAGNDRLDVLELRAAMDLVESAPLPSVLAAFGRTAERSATVERSFVLDGTNINGRQMDPGRVDETVQLGATELWSVTNDVGMPHSFHVHDVQFQIASIDGVKPPPELAGWKDTVYLRPKTEYRLLMTFEDYADPDVPYMYHCHLLAHEDDGMMGQFVVVEPGERAGTPPSWDDDETDDDRTESATDHHHG